MLSFSVHVKLLNRIISMFPPHDNRVAILLHNSLCCLAKQ